MNQDSDIAKVPPPEKSKAQRVLTPEARRALAEAEARRVKAADDAARATEFNGRGGLEPVRFGDWEVKGIATDF
jgi:hypothetical protein